MSILKFLGNSSDKLTIPNPISKNNIEDVYIEIGKMKSIFRGGKHCSAKIHFKNGDTQAQHQIFDHFNFRSK